MVEKGEELRGLITENEGEGVEGGLKKEVVLETVNLDLWLTATATATATAMDVSIGRRSKRCRFKNGKRGLRAYIHIRFDWWASAFKDEQVDKVGGTASPPAHSPSIHQPGNLALFSNFKAC